MLNIKKVLSVFACTAITIASISFGGMTVCAAEESPYTPINGGTVQFDKYLVMKEGIECPEKNFTFAISPGQAITGTDTTYDVYAGPNGAKLGTGNSNKASVAFTHSTPVYTTAQARDGSVGGQAQDVVNLENGQQYAKVKVPVNLTACQFTHPGIYRFKIIEVTPTNKSATGVTGTTYDYVDYDPNYTRYLDVYVRYNGEQGDPAPTYNSNFPENSLYIGEYVMHTEASPVYANGTTSQTDVKNGGYRNVYNTCDLRIEKTVSGNLGDKTEFYPITISFTYAGYGDHAITGNFTQVVKPAEGSEPAVTNPTVLAVPSSGRITQTFWLQDGDYVILDAIQKNASYTISENAADMDAEGYTTTITITGDTTEITKNDAEFTASDTALTEDTTINFNNTKNMVIETGIQTEFLPYIMILAMAGAVVIGMKKKQRD